MKLIIFYLSILLCLNSFSSQVKISRSFIFQCKLTVSKDQFKTGESDGGKYNLNETSKVNLKVNDFSLTLSGFKDLKLIGDKDKRKYPIVSMVLSHKGYKFTQDILENTQMTLKVQTPSEEEALAVCFPQ